MKIKRTIRQGVEWGVKHRKRCFIILGLALVLVLATPFVFASSTPHWQVPTKTLGGVEIKNSPAGYVAFYQHFSKYLTPHSGIDSFIVTMAGALLQGLCGLVDVLQKMFTQAVKFMGVFSNLKDQHTTLGQLFHASQIAGILIFCLTAVIYGFFSLFKSDKDTPKKMLQTLILLTAGFSFIPFCLNTAQGFTTKAIDGYQQTVHTPNLGTAILQDNVVDKYVLNAKNWDVPLQDGLVKNARKYNHIQNIGDFDAGEMAGVMTDKTLKTMDQGRNDRDASAQVIFENFLYHLPTTNGQANQSLLGYHKPAHVITSLNMFKPNYLRYKVTWLPAFFEALAICALLVLMTVKVIASIFQILTTAIVSPILISIRSTSPKKAKEIFSSLLFGCAGIGFDFIIIYCALGMMSWLQTGQAAVLLNGLPAYGGLLIRSMAYVAIFMGAFSGVGIIEKFLGVSSGKGNALRQVMAGAVIARATGATARNTKGAVTGYANKVKNNAQDLHASEMGRFVPPTPAPFHKNNDRNGTGTGASPNDSTPYRQPTTPRDDRLLNEQSQAPSGAGTPPQNQTDMTDDEKTPPMGTTGATSPLHSSANDDTPDQKTQHTATPQMDTENSFETPDENNEIGTEASPTGEKVSQTETTSYRQPTTPRYERMLEEQAKQTNQIKLTQEKQTKQTKEALYQQKHSQRAQMAKQFRAEAMNNLGQVGSDNHIGKEEDND